MTLQAVATDPPQTRTIVLGVDSISCPSGQAVLESAGRCFSAQWLLFSCERRPPVPKSPPSAARRAAMYVARVAVAGSSLGAAQGKCA
jgi:hypothetical protein